MKKRKKHSIRKMSICESCGEPPGWRDDGRLVKSKGEWKCGDCLLSEYDSDEYMAELRESIVTRNSCPLGASEDLMPKPVTISLKERDNINHVAMECRVNITRREWSQGVEK